MDHRGRSARRGRLVVETRAELLNTWLHDEAAMLFDYREAHRHRSALGWTSRSCAGHCDASGSSGVGNLLEGMTPECASWTEGDQSAALQPPRARYSETANMSGLGETRGRAAALLTPTARGRVQFAAGLYVGHGGLRALCFKPPQGSGEPSSQARPQWLAEESPGEKAGW